MHLFKTEVNSHDKINFFKVYNLVCNHQLSNSKYFHYLKGNPIPIKQSLFIPLVSHSLETTNLLSASMDLPYLDI